MDGGVAHLRVDNQKRDQVDGRKRLETGGFGAAPDRYEIEILGGASEVRIGAS